MRIIYLGTPAPATIPLKALLQDRRFEVVAVVSQTDKPKNRKKQLEPTEVKKFVMDWNAGVNSDVVALDKNKPETKPIPILQFENINKHSDQLADLNADVFITCAYGQILSPSIIDLAKYGILNIHYSLLPEYRGAAPVVWALLNGDKRTGVTIMQTEKGVDTGKIILQKHLDIQYNKNSAVGDNLKTLLCKLSDMGSELLMETLLHIKENGGVLKGKFKHKAQDNAKATHARKIVKEDGHIDFTRQTATQIINRIRALTAVFFYMGGERIKVYQAKEITAQELESDLKSGAVGQVVLSCTKRGLIIKCKGETYVQILELLAGSGNKMLATDFLRGWKKPLEITFTE
ncbi:MAG: methionyl-tRNA formyltransferase [Firmicutes bacterium]|nr:methionyl-tRNA formyltransferase [Bacillota bacterium]